MFGIPRRSQQGQTSLQDNAIFANKGLLIENNSVQNYHQQSHEVMMIIFFHLTIPMDTPTPSHLLLIERQPLPSSVEKLNPEKIS
jgi:hypothetical protein